MFKHTISIPQINYTYFCGIIYHSMAYKAIIAGATGLIGSKLLGILLNEPAYDEVLIFVRKDTGLQHKKLVQVIIDFDRLADYAEMITGHAIFCCLGSTKKKTPDLKDYRKIDHDYPLQLAQLGLQNGVKQYHLVSALGADAASSNFYNKMKGETERDIKQLSLPCLHIYQPSLLTGDREEYRLAERIVTPIVKLLNPLLFGGWKKYRSIEGETVAMAMFKQSITNDDGLFVHPSDNIKQIA
jgi:uncharacterized protein YbjT (DUF2867 family)